MDKRIIALASWQIIDLLRKAEIRLWLQSRLRMRSVTKFFLDLKQRNRTLSQSIQKTLISLFFTEFPVKILRKRTEALRWKFDWNIVFSAFINSCDGRGTAKKCCIFIDIRCNYDVHHIRNVFEKCPRYLSQRVK